MLNRPTLFGSRDQARDPDRGVLTTQTKPNPAQPPSPAAEAVRATAERGAQNPADRPSAAVTGNEIPPMPQGPGTAHGKAPVANPSVPPAPTSAAAAASAPQAAPSPAPVERTPAGSEARMVVGPNIKMRGVEINDCDTLIVEGTVEATMDARQIEVAQSGSYTGKASVDNAEIHGLFTGELTVRKRLQIHATGKVGGTLRYGKMIVEEGGEIAGDIRSLAGDSRAQAELKPFVAESRPEASRPAADAIPARR